MSESVKVAVRCRPLNDRELEANYDIVVSVDPIEKQVVLRQPTFNVPSPQKVYTFDSVYGTNATNEDIYTEIVSPLVNSILMGYNGCVFAFGQTSCGKTFSMQGVDQPAAQRGVMSRTFEQIFQHIYRSGVTYYVVRTSYLEIYNEEIRDLLHKNNASKLEVKEHPEKGVYVKDLTSVDVTCVDDMEEVLEVGSWNRVLGATAQNPDSSRSHCIFTVEFELCYISKTDGKEHVKTGRLNLVDLAGSERQRYSKAEGERFKEATKINLSLSALGNVISALVNEKAKHIPYRASKLTRLLQDSLGGNSRTLMIACVSPGENNYGETLSTLRYANRAKNIKNRPRINEDPKDALIRQYQKEIKMLRQLLSNQMKITGEVPVLPLSFIETEEEIKDRAVPICSAVVISNQERIAYEQQITGLRHRYDNEMVSRERLESTLKSMKTEYENYRLKKEYETKKLKNEYERKLLNYCHDKFKTDTESDESAYISANSDTEVMSWDSSLCLEKQDKGTLLSPAAENAHLWSYQWLKCYCDSNRRNLSSNSMFSLNKDFEKPFHCICVEQIRDSPWNEKGSQTCQICMQRHKVINNDETNNIITKEPCVNSDSSSNKQVQKMDIQEKRRYSICCWWPCISFFGEQYDN